MNRGVPMSKKLAIDNKSYMLGVIAAFSECVGNECKRASLSAPASLSDTNLMQTDAERIAAEYDVHLWLEENPDLPEEKREYWWVLYKYPEVLDQYQALRAKGYNPLLHFDKFRQYLSYGTVWGINSEKVIPRLKEEK